MKNSVQKKIQTSGSAPAGRNRRKEPGFEVSRPTVGKEADSRHRQPWVPGVHAGTCQGEVTEQTWVWDVLWFLEDFPVADDSFSGQLPQYVYGFEYITKEMEQRWEMNIYDV